MKSSGITIPWIKDHALKGPDDFAPLIHIFNDLVIEPDHQGYLDWAAPVGEEGLAAVYATHRGLAHAPHNEGPGRSHPVLLPAQGIIPGKPWSWPKP